MSPIYPPPPPLAARLHTVGVTGTNGKTTSATWLWAILQAQRPPVGLVSTVGVRIGERGAAPLVDHAGLVSHAEALHGAGGDTLVIELTSVALAAGFAAAWPVQVGVFTNLSQDHEDQHPSPADYLAAKAQLFVHLRPGGVAVLNASDPASTLIRQVIPAGVRVMSYAAPWRAAAASPWPTPPDLELSEGRVVPGGATARLGGPLAETLGGRIEVRAPGLHFLENGAAALLAAVAMGADPVGATRTLARAPAPPGRLELVHDAPRVYVDYAHTPDALARTLAAAAAAHPGAPLWVVFGAGGERSRAKRRPLGQAAAAADHVVLTSDNPRREDPARIAAEVAEGLAGHPSLHLEPDRAAAIAHALRRAAPEDVVVIAGRGHERVQEGPRGPRDLDDAAIARHLLARPGGP